MADRVTYGAQYTRNLGNFENARVFFEITTDVRDGEDIEKARKRVVAKVDQWVSDKIDEIDAEAGN